MKCFSKANSLKTKIVRILQNNSGEGFVDTAVKILISVVIGGLLMGGLYLLFKDTVLPTLTQKVTEMFNYTGN
ncbi:MAG: hypothetical protein GX236_09885 [Clostridiaceae bacterium]|nr:hypothetical protein [Clostridiaceae bacterium]